MKHIFKNNENVPTHFIQNIDEIFKIWRDKWEIFDNKYCQGLFMYTYNYNSLNNIEIYYSNYIKKEIDKYSDTIGKIIDPQKIKILGYENGLDTECDYSEIIIGLKKIKKMELINNLSKDIDGNEIPDIPQISEKETSTIQRILKTMNENFNHKNNNTEVNNNNLNSNKSNEDNLEDDIKTINNNNDEESITPENKNEELYNDIDGEPI